MVGCIRPFPAYERRVCQTIHLFLKCYSTSTSDYPSNERKRTIPQSHTGNLMLEVTEESFLQGDLGFQYGLILGLRWPARLIELESGLRHC